MRCFFFNGEAVHVLVPDSGRLLIWLYIHVIVTLSILFLFLRGFFLFMILKLVILNLFYLILYHAHKDITQACTFYVIKFTPFYDNNTMYLTPNLVNYLFFNAWTATIIAFKWKETGQCMFYIILPYNDS